MTDAERYELLARAADTISGATSEQCLQAHEDRTLLNLLAQQVTSGVETLDGALMRAFRYGVDYGRRGGR